MKITLILILTALSTLGAEILTTKRTAGVVSYPATTVVNSAIFETDGSGNLVLTPKSVYATSASLSSYLTSATAASTYQPIGSYAPSTGIAPSAITGTALVNGGNAGTPSAIVLTNATGTATSLTAGNATTVNGWSRGMNSFITTGNAGSLEIAANSFPKFPSGHVINFTTTANSTPTFPAGTSTLASLAGTETLTNKSISSGQITGLGALATVTPGTNVTTALAIAADATGGMFRQGQALSATTVTASGAVSSGAVLLSVGTTIWDGTLLMYPSARFSANGYSDAVVVGQGPNGQGQIRLKSANPLTINATTGLSSGGFVDHTTARSNFLAGSDGLGALRVKARAGHTVAVFDVVNSSDTAVFGVTKEGNLTASGTVTGTEQGSAPAAPAANGYTLYAEDNGSGKTRLMVRFASGAAQQLAIEP